MTSLTHEPDCQVFLTSSFSISDRDYTYVCSLSSCHLLKPAKELIFYLPEAIRPKLISNLVTEQISLTVVCDLHLDCPFYKAYSKRIHSDAFKHVRSFILAIKDLQIYEGTRSVNIWLLGNLVGC
mgnify:CR=1 FL=1